MNRNKLKNILQCLVVLICLVLIGSYFLKHQDELKVIFSLDLKYILLLIVTVITIQLITALKLFIIIKNAGLKQCGYFNWFKIFSVGNFMNLHMPQGANIYRAIQLKSKYQFTYTNSISAITFIAWSETIAVLIFSCLTLALTRANVVIHGINILHGMIIAIVTIITIPFLLNWLLSKPEYSNSAINWIHRKISELIGFLTTTMKSYKLVGCLFFLSFLSYVLYLLCMNTGFSAINVHLNLSALSLFTVIILVSNLIYIIPGNIGITELLCGYLIQNMGETMGSGIMVAGLLRILVYMVNVFWAILFAKTISFKKVLDTNGEEQSL